MTDVASSQSPDIHDRPFASTRFRFSPGVPAGEAAEIRGADHQTLLTYRGFASVITIVAALVDAIVLTTGFAAMLFLLAEHRGPAAATAILLSLGFAAVIAMLVPRTRVTLYEGVRPVLTVSQRSLTMPAATYYVTTADGKQIASFHHSIFSRLGRNRWSISLPEGGRAWAIEESLTRAMLRKLLGKFDRRHQANVRIFNGSGAAGLIVRRPDQTGEADYLDLPASGTFDRRVAVALATLIFGLEP